MLDGVEYFEQTRDAASVVVGAVMDVAEWAEAVAGGAIADVIVVSADDDGLVFELRVAAFNDSDDVARGGIERLEIGSVIAGGSSAELFERFEQVIGGSAAAAAAG